jgi:hypothetical protein
MTTPSHHRGTQLRTWYVGHALGITASLFALLVFGMACYLHIADAPPTMAMPRLMVILASFGIVTLIWIWISMLVDFFRQRPERFPVLWGFALTMGTWMGGILYFWLVWRKRNRPAR